MFIIFKTKLNVDSKMPEMTDNFFFNDYFFDNLNLNYFLYDSRIVVSERIVVGLLILSSSYYYVLDIYPYS